MIASLVQYSEIKGVVTETTLQNGAINAIEAEQKRRTAALWGRNGDAITSPCIWFRVEVTTSELNRASYPDAVHVAVI